MTGGLASGARTGEDLLEIYRRIDELETTEIQSVEYTNYDESFAPYAASGLGALLASWLLSWTVFRRVGGDWS
jgi:Ca-activated chloride channel family protein